MTDATAVAEEASQSPPQEIFHLDLHAWIEAQQTSHGVRHDDYAQYHGYCTRRLSRLSHLKEAKKYLASSSKFATVKPSSGGRHAYCSRFPDTLGSQATYVPHINVLWYLLVMSERSWAHANQFSKHAAKRQQVLAKFKRATQWAELLLTKAQVAGDSTTIQECEAYASWMKANYALEKYDYMTASQEYANAMTLCHKLSQDTAGIDDPAKQLERQDLFVTRADTVLRPLFRYCQYELKQAGVAVERLVEEPRLASKSNSSTDAKKDVEEKDDISIVFRGKELAMDSKELRVVMLKLQSLQHERGTISAAAAAAAATTTSSTLEESKHSGDGGDETSFLTILSVLDDALEIVQGQLSTLEQASSGPAVQAKRQEYLLWKGYLQFQKTQRVMDHTAGLLQSIAGHAERVHIYDALLQHAKFLLQLPRPGDNDTIGQAEEDDEFALQAQANILRLRALKTYHMACYYYQELSNCKSGWALLEQSMKLCKRAKEEIAACDEDMPHSEEYLEELDALPLASTKAAMQAAWYLDHGALGGGESRRNKATKRPLLLRLKDQDAGMVLAGELEPIPIPCKPVFFDLALKYALDTTKSLDPIETYLDEHTVKEDLEPSQSSGGKSLLGWLTG